MTETQWAIRNLELAGFFDPKSDYDGGIGKAVQELLEVLGKQGHSGASHAQTVQVFHEVARGRSFTRKHWDERFTAFKELAKSHGDKHEYTVQEYESASGHTRPE